MEKSAAFESGFSDGVKQAAKRDMPSFLSQDRPESVKKIYRALKKDHPGMPAAMKARIAARQGRPGKQHQGPPYAAPLSSSEKKAGLVPKKAIVAGAALAVPYVVGKNVREQQKNSIQKNASFKAEVNNSIARNDKKEKDLKWIGRAAGSTAVGALAAPVATIPLQLALISSLKKNTGNLTNEDVKKLQNHLGTKADILEISDASKSIAVPGFLSPNNKPTIFSSKKSPEILAHELGHIKNYGEGKLPARALYKYRKFGPLAGLIGGSLMAAKGDEGSNSVKYAPLLALAGQGGYLADEAAASYRGYKALKSLGLQGPNMRRNLAKAFATYGLAAAATTAPVAYLSWKRGWSKNKKNK